MIRLVQCLASLAINWGQHSQQQQKSFVPHAHSPSTSAVLKNGVEDCMLAGHSVNLYNPRSQRLISNIPLYYCRSTIMATSPWEVGKLVALLRDLSRLEGLPWSPLTGLTWTQGQREACTTGIQSLVLNGPVLVGLLVLPTVPISVRPASISSHGIV